MAHAPLPLPDWPNGADVAVCLTFDVDAESGRIAPGFEQRLSALSESRFGIHRGLPRIFDLLRRKEARGTFYVPGATAERHPDAVRAIVAAGHEVAHHGHDHLQPHQVDAATQRAEIERGLAALDAIDGIRPAGYRSPAWELTPETLDLLLEHGFAYDSSCMGDDRPYLERHDGREILELPVDWSVDDYPYFGWSVAAGGNLTSPSDLVDCWLAEFESALADRRVVTYTMHPEVIGRGFRMRALERLLDEMLVRGSVWFPAHGDVAALVGAPAAHGE
jgi:peptidoglycan/xylan/chitin deacetylase (PgdA/CDA1 family)